MSSVVQTMLGHRRIDYRYRYSAPNGGGTVVLAPMPKVVVWEAPLKGREIATVLRANVDWQTKSAIDFGRYPASLTRLAAEVRDGIEVGMTHLGIGVGDYVADGEPSVLCGEGAEFHFDEGFGAPVAFFCVVAIAGEGDFVMPNLGVRVPFTPGTAVLFDPMELHGITRRGESDAGTTPFICLSSDIKVPMEAATKLGLQQSGGGVDLSALSLCHSTGRLRRANRKPQTLHG